MRYGSHRTTKSVPRSSLDLFAKNDPFRVGFCYVSVRPHDFRSLEPSAFGHNSRSSTTKCVIPGRTGISDSLAEETCRRSMANCGCCYNSASRIVQCDTVDHDEEERQNSDGDLHDAGSVCVADVAKSRSDQWHISVGLQQKLCASGRCFPLLLTTLAYAIYRSVR